MTKRLLWLLFLTACTARPDTSPPPDLAIASSDYVVLAQKALTWQADFDLEGWATLLADSVTFALPDHPPARRPKAHLLRAWQHWRDTGHVQTLRLYDFTLLPVSSAQRLAFSGRAGVYVVTYCTAHLQRTDGRTAQLPLTLCFHFDADKQIDDYRFYAGTTH